MRAQQSSLDLNMAKCRPCKWQGRTPRLLQNALKIREIALLQCSSPPLPPHPPSPYPSSPSRMLMRRCAPYDAVCAKKSTERERDREREREKEAEKTNCRRAWWIIGLQNAPVEVQASHPALFPSSCHAVFEHMRQTVFFVQGERKKRGRKKKLGDNKRDKAERLSQRDGEPGFVRYGSRMNTLPLFLGTLGVGTHSSGSNRFPPLSLPQISCDGD